MTKQGGTSSDRNQNIRGSDSSLTNVQCCGGDVAEVYEQKSETSRHIKQQRFFQCQFEENGGKASFMSKLQEMQNQLKQLGEVKYSLRLSIGFRYTWFIVYGNSM